MTFTDLLVSSYQPGRLVLPAGEGELVADMEHPTQSAQFSETD